MKIGKNEKRDDHYSLPCVWAEAHISVQSGLHVTRVTSPHWTRRHCRCCMGPIGLCRLSCHAPRELMTSGHCSRHSVFFQHIRTKAPWGLLVGLSGFDHKILVGFAPLGLGSRVYIYDPISFILNHCQEASMCRESPP